MGNRILITGMGLVSPFGVGNETFIEAFNRGDKAIKDLTLFPPPSSRRWRVGEVSDFTPSDILGSRGLRNHDRVTLLLMAASELLHRDLGFEDLESRRKHYKDEEVSIVVGTMASLKSISDFDADTVKDPRYVRPGLFPNTVLCAAASYAAIRRSIKESCATITNGDPSALYAVGYGMDHLLSGRVRMSLVGAAEELSDIFLMISLNVALSKGYLTPVLSEGAQLFSMELGASADERGANKLAEVIGFTSWHCPDLQAGYDHGLSMIQKKVGGDIMKEIKHVYSCSKLIDETSNLPNPDVTVHQPFRKFGHMSSMGGAMAMAMALTDRTIKAGDVILINCMSVNGGGACLVLRKLAG